MKTLPISKNLSLPTKTVTEKLAWLGTTGSGKTYGASNFAEQCWHIGAQFVVLDPVGVWYGLRLAKDGKKPSKINIPIFGGLHGDVPLESTGGELLANLVVDKGLSCIIDVSQFESDTEKARFATDFANKFFFRKKASPSAVHLFLEECQEFVPQNPAKGEERMLHAFVRMQKLGRNFGIGSSYISQRPQEVNKKALNMCQTLFVFRTTGTHERTAIEKWIEDKSLDETIAQDLPKIPTGSCHVWSPEFLKISEMIKISKKETFNASATPEVGAVAKARLLAPIDLEKVRDEMKATIEKAKQEDPKELQKEIGKLKQELVIAGRKTATSLPAAMGVSQWLEYGKKLGYDKFFLDKIEKQCKEKIVEYERFIKRCKEIMSKIDRDFYDSHNSWAILSGMSPKAKIGVRGDFSPNEWDSKTSNSPKTPVKISVEKKIEPLVNSNIQEETKPVSGSALRRILKVLVNRYPIKLTRTQLATLCKLRPTTGTFSTYISLLRTNKFISTEGDLFSATEAGIEYTGEQPAAPQTPEEKIEMWRSNLPPGALRIFDVVLKSSQMAEFISKEEIGIQTSLSHTTGTFSTYLSILRSNGLISVDGNMVKLSSELSSY